MSEGSTTDLAERENAIERVVGFAEKFDGSHLDLACHAAFPLVLTPDLLYQIWLRFVPQAPWTAVARVLLSRLCREVGYELYEMDVAVRNLLLTELKEDERFGQKQLEKLADFLSDYVKQQFAGEDSYSKNLAQGQNWTALAYTKPNELIPELLEAIESRLKEENWSELFRLSSLIETFAEPLQDFAPVLITYARGMARFTSGQIESATEYFNDLPRRDRLVNINGVSLSIPNEIPINTDRLAEIPQELDVHHLLIGLPGSGKSAFAEQLAQVDPHYIVISTDRIRGELFGDEAVQSNWAEVEAEVLRRVKRAVQEGRRVIYDATNSQRAHRLDWLEKAAAVGAEPWMAWYLQVPVETCLERNQKRSRQVPEGVILAMAASLEASPPDFGEGLVAIEEIAVALSLEEIRARIAKGKDNFEMQKRRNSKYGLHRYSRLLDFERLMHLISVILEYPGVGNLEQTDPETLKEIFRADSVPHFESDLEELSAIMAGKKGAVYADKAAIAADLEWLERNGILGAKEVSAEIEVERLEEAIVEKLERRGRAVRRYAEIEPFARLMKLIRYIAHYPLNTGAEPEDGEERKTSQEQLVEQLIARGVFALNEWSNIRKDIEKALKPYRILPDFAMRKGYFVGTAIFSKKELEDVYKVLQSQQMHLDDPLASDMKQLFQARIASSRLLDMKQTYPTRAIAHESIVDIEGLPSNNLARRLDELELAIEEGKLLRLVKRSRTASYQGQYGGEFCVYPLQIVFQNIAWYLGYEIQGGEDDGLLHFQRLDRLELKQEEPKSRSIEEQREALHRLTRLYKACPGIFLGNSAADQGKFLSRDRAERQSVMETVELWVSDNIYQFLIEGTKRYPRAQMKMSAPTKQIIEDQTLFSLKQTGDKQFPNRYRLSLPKWSVPNEEAIGDVQLRREILAYGHNLKVVHPQSLARLIKREGEGISRNY